jgi:hypothetical protein
MSLFDDLVQGVEGAASSAIGFVENAASGLGECGNVVGPMMSGLLGGGSPLGQLPQLFSGLFQMLSPQQQFSCPSMPLPFSPMSSGIQGFLNNPNQLFQTLGGGATSGGLGALLNSVDTGGISGQINNLMNDAQQQAVSGDPLTAQKELIQAQVMFQTISNFLNIIGQLQKTAVQNSKLQ